MFETRFAVAEDGDGSWSVVDAETSAPATAGPRRLTSLSEGEAKDAADLLNMAASFKVRRPAAATAPAQTPHPFLLPIR